MAAKRKRILLSHRDPEGGSKAATGRRLRGRAMRIFDFSPVTIHETMILAVLLEIESVGLFAQEGNSAGQCRHIPAERPGNLYQRDEREVVFAALHPAHVTAIEPRLMRQPFLRHAEIASRHANSPTEDVEIRVHARNSCQSGVIVHGV